MNPSASFLEVMISRLQGIEATGYIIVASATIVYYDYLLTLGKEGEPLRILRLFGHISNNRVLLSNFKVDILYPFFTFIVDRNSSAWTIYTFQGTFKTGCSDIVLTTPLSTDPLLCFPIPCDCYNVLVAFR